MTAALARRVPHMPGESPQSLMSRLAARNGIALADLARDMDLPSLKVAYGDHHALDRLGWLADVDPARLRREGLVKLSERWAFRGQAITRRMLRRSRTYLCARCLAEDVAGSDLPAGQAAYGRTSWLIEQIRTCPVHAVALIPSTVPDTDPRVTDDFVLRARPILLDLDRHVDEAGARAASELERHLLDRFDGMSGRGWLDDLKVHVAAELCERVGVTALYGASTSINGLDEDELRAAGDAGFAIASDGREGLAAFFEGMRKNVPPAKANTDGQKLLGLFWSALDNKEGDPDFAPVREVMAELMVASKPVAPGKVVLGIPAPARVLHSIRTGAIEAGVHPKTFRRILEQEGMLPEGHETSSDALLTFDVETIARIFERLENSWGYKQAMAYANVPRHPAVALHRAGIIRERSRGKGSKNATFYLEFAKDDLDAFLGDLLAGAEDRTEAGPDEVTIQEAAHRNVCSNVEVVRLILDRKLGWVGRLTGERGFMAALVRCDEVGFLVKGSEPEGVTEGRVRHRIQAHHMSVPALVKAGKLDVITLQHPRTRAAQRYVTGESIERFEATYASLSKLGSELGRAGITVGASLSKRGIQPALTAREFHSAFYLRADIPKAI